MKYAKTPFELSRPLRVDKVPMSGIEEHIVASPNEREALARRFGLSELPFFEARLSVDRGLEKTYSVTGTFKAQTVQPCVVTLEPVSKEVKGAIDVVFSADAKAPQGALDAEAADPPEPIDNGKIDLGEVAVQHLALVIDPYPRKQGAVFDGVSAQTIGKEGGGPFASLSDKIKKKAKTRG